MQWLLQQGMLGIVLIGACRVNESSCNHTAVSGREWIRLIEHLNKREEVLNLHTHTNTVTHSDTHTHKCKNTPSVSHTHKHSLLHTHKHDQFTHQALYWSGYLLLGSLAMAFQLRLQREGETEKGGVKIDERRKRQEKWPAHLLCPLFCLLCGFN